MRRQKILKSTLYSAGIFIFIAIYTLITSAHFEIDKLYVLFLGDFSIGICPRLLVGEIISLFKESVTKEWVVSFLIVFTYAVFLFVCIYICNSLTAAERSNKKTLMIFTFLFIIAPASIGVYTGNIFGGTDIFMFAVFVLTAFFAENKILIWTLPVFVTMGILIHDAYILSYLAPCLGIIAYHAIRSRKENIKASVIFVITSVCSFAGCIYSVVFSRKTIVMSEQETIEYLANKGNCSVNEVTGYIEQVLFFKNTTGGLVDTGDKSTYDSVFDMLKFMIEAAWDNRAPMEYIQALATIPFIILICCVWVKCIRNSQGFFNKMPYILFLLTLIPQTVSALIISMDVIRFVATMTITQFFYVLICAKKKDEVILPVLEKIGNTPLMYLPSCILMLLVNMY